MTLANAIEGIGEVYAEKLKASGIKSVDALLTACANKSGRDKVAAATGISDKLILKWANHADLQRINGIGAEYSELLEAAGVDTVVELAARKAGNLAAKLVEINNAKQVVRQVASEKMVADWIDQAKALPRVMTY